MANDYAGYKTLLQPGLYETVIKKSRFIGQAAPVEDEESALDFISRVREEHRDATHNVYAYQIKPSLRRFSDDGEPGGTAGMPVLQAIVGAGLERCVVVVTRYFGGILLGARGLVRAYSDAAGGALRAGQPVMMIPTEVLEVTLDYPDWGRIEHHFKEEGLPLVGTEFLERVRVRVLCPKADREGLVSRLMELTSGRAEVKSLRTTHYPEHEGKIIVPSTETGGGQPG